MEAYACYYGGWNDYHQSFTWQKLTDAIEQCDFNIPRTGASGAGGLSGHENASRVSGKAKEIIWQHLQTTLSL